MTISPDSFKWKSDVSAVLLRVCNKPLTNIINVSGFKSDPSVIPKRSFIDEPGVRGDVISPTLSDPVSAGYTIFTAAIVTGKLTDQI